jgi:hypothetical protein
MQKSLAQLESDLHRVEEIIKTKRNNGSRCGCGTSLEKLLIERNSILNEIRNQKNEGQKG